MNNFKLKTIVRQQIYYWLGTVDKILKNENNLVVYAYHNIINHPWVFNVQLSKFEKQMSYLSSVGKFISLKELELYFDGKLVLPEKSFVITFDDGYKGVKSVIETTEKYGISPIVFALGQEAEVDRYELSTKSHLLDKKELKFLRSLGWEVGSHGLTHKKLTSLGKVGVKREIEGSKKFIEKQINDRVISFSYPHGKYNEQILDEVKSQGYSTGFTMDDGIITKSTNHFAIPRVGVMGNHSMEEFKYLASPSVIGFRRLVKKTFLSKFI